MRKVRVILVLVVALLMVSPLLAGEKKGGKGGKKKAARCPVAERTKYLEGMTLTDEQKAKFEKIKQEFVPKFTAAQLKVESVFTPEQKKARQEAAKEAKQAGKSTKETHEAANEAVKLTDEQKTKLAEARKDLTAVDKDLQAAVKAILTPEQQKEIKKAHRAKKKEGK